VLAPFACRGHAIHKLPTDTSTRMLT
jgi:hypothetical protein